MVSTAAGKGSRRAKQRSIVEEATKLIDARGAHLVTVIGRNLWKNTRHGAKHVVVAW